MIEASSDERLEDRSTDDEKPRLRSCGKRMNSFGFKKVMCEGLFN